MHTSAQTPSTLDIHDYVIVGGGSAGAVLAKRLSESGDNRVLLLEAGSAPHAEAYPPVLTDANRIAAPDAPQFDWGYYSEPQGTTPAIFLPRGKVLGGCSAVNAAVAIRAPQWTFDQWAKEGLQGWSFDEVLPFFKRMERSTYGADRWHGRTGEFPIHRMSRDFILRQQNAFIDAAIHQGHQEVTDFNSDLNEGVGTLSMNIINGVRVNTGMTYLDQTVRQRENLTIRTGVVADRIEFSGKRARAIISAQGERFQGREIILCAGAYGSPAILMRSGIGLAQDLSRLGIRPLVDTPVGQNLQEHPFYFMGYASPAGKLDDCEGPIAGAQLWTHSTQAEPGELDLAILPEQFLIPNSPTGAGMTLSVALLSVRSRGQLRLSSAEPTTAPTINLNLLHHPQDMRRMVEGVHLARELAATQPLASYLLTELTPGAAIKSDAQLRDDLLRNISIYQHPTSTAMMGREDDSRAVTDPQGRVYGTDGLRVVDASILPSVPLINPNPTIIAIAEKIAATLLGQAPLLPVMHG